MPETVRIRVCLAVVIKGAILLVPHYDTDQGPVQWVIPGGGVNFGESLAETARREFQEETGLQAEISRLLEVSEVILPERPYHSITVTFSGSITGGELAPEAGHRYGVKLPRWFSAQELSGVNYHPKSAVEKALGNDL